ncbi:hypothetical protein E2542_SST06355 [Spatholobus suberectus]|nr:hypothetical protein E2542_SST06355 [Spatholobus suberectus]
MLLFFLQPHNLEPHAPQPESENVKRKRTCYFNCKRKSHIVNCCDCSNNKDELEKKKGHKNSSVSASSTGPPVKAKQSHKQSPSPKPHTPFLNPYPHEPSSNIRIKRKTFPHPPTITFEPELKPRNAPSPTPRPTTVTKTHHHHQNPQSTPKYLNLHEPKPQRHKPEPAPPHGTGTATSRRTATTTAHGGASSFCPVALPYLLQPLAVISPEPPPCTRRSLRRQQQRCVATTNTCKLESHRSPFSLSFSRAHLRSPVPPRRRQHRRRHPLVNRKGAALPLSRRAAASWKCPNALFSFPNFFYPVFTLFTLPTVGSHLGQTQFLCF